ncbi:hypothetical protein [Azospirillum brasilense]|uniref:hypothetical protein n=1 Tax=Azospirillum brasilense TaxID=192 RepID=UPI0010C021F6|nr:hypothetical protein [Azospirillum brasilense]
MKTIVCSFLAVSVVAAVIVVVAVLFIPANVPAWEPSYSATGDAVKEVAKALSTAPDYLAQPTKFALYHWQTLIAGVLAFIAGLSAFAAAAVGATALRDQTNVMARATTEAAETQANALVRQAEEATASVKMQIDDEAQRYAREVSIRRRALFRALLANANIIKRHNKGCVIALDSDEIYDFEASRFRNYIVPTIPPSYPVNWEDYSFSEESVTEKSFDVILEIDTAKRTLDGYFSSVSSDAKISRSFGGAIKKVFNSIDEKCDALISEICEKMDKNPIGS